MTQPVENNFSPVHSRRGLLLTVVCWCLLSIILIGLGLQNRSQPGLYYDEAVYGGMSKDFLEARHRSPHMPGVQVVNLSGRPFPLFIQPYLGALKCWMLLPVFKLFGLTQPVLRMANLGWSLLGLLLCMVWVYRAFGTWESLAVGCLLASDPGFFFLSVVDWGVAVPSFVCRTGGLLLALFAVQKRSVAYSFFAGLVFGLGFFNKIDFVTFLLGITISAVLVWRRECLMLVRSKGRMFIACSLGFILGVGPMFFNLPQIIRDILTGETSFAVNEFPEKINTLRTMYDGSYFYRLFTVGGSFQRMQHIASPVWSPLGIVLIVSIFLQIALYWRSSEDKLSRQKRTFVLLAGVLVTLGILLLPGADRIHHTALIYPLPHLLLAVTIVGAWNGWKIFSKRRWLLRGSAMTVTMVVLIFQFIAIVQTESLIRRTGGSGWWSSALNRFCSEYAHATDISIVSLDWGFSEQLDFLTDGPRLLEPFWGQYGSAPLKLPRDPNFVYLVHPPEYTLLPFGDDVLRMALRGGNNVRVKAWRDRAGGISFYSVRFL
jgi:hypothetical protein